MIIGIPKEIKPPQENRVSLTPPAGADALIRAGHKVLIETEAGIGSGFTDESYTNVGAEILEADSIWQRADMILKVKEPLPSEYKYFRKGLIIFTFLHLANEPELTKALKNSKTIALAYETVQLPTGVLPILTPMSEIAGRMAVQQGSIYLEKKFMVERVS